MRHSYLVDCVLEDGASVGPFAYLRPGTVLRKGAKAGTFVEVKNSDIGPGAKIPHLSYIGDADVGEGTNLGAATITANYDGRAKHRTTIGARRAHERRHDARRAGDRRRRRLHGRRLGHHRGRAARARSGSPASVSKNIEGYAGAQCARPDGAIRPSATFTLQR